ncbi:MAG: DUF4424 domain-containing protein [Pseudomonadota bacterium]|nr:DUF4424 domain-containing protein [Pseudomonadota bacterium]
MRILLLAAGMAAFLAPAAQANDSVAEVAAGGLVLRQTDQIDMLSEDLYVSAEQVRVRYVFRNQAPQDVRVTVAFPLPDRDLADEYEGDTSWPADFVTRVDGSPVAMQVEQRALLGGTDHTELLRQLGVPVAAENIRLAAEEAIDRLTAEQQQRLLRLGLVEAHEYDSGRGMRRHFSPRWMVKETWYWEQVFPAGRDLVVEHSYTPAVGGSVDTLLGFPDLRNSPEGRRHAAEFCVEPDFIAAIDRMRARSTPERPALIGEQRIRYILTTGANWRSPIGEFRLVVDKGRPENIVSFCGEGVRRISPTQFEVRRRNWRPDRDLNVLIVTPYPEGG